MFVLILLLLFCFEGSHAVILNLNASEYDLMPPIFGLDDHEACLRDVNPVYCYVETTLVSDTPSPLLHMIQEYSARVNNHFNHSRIRRGVCVTQSCKQFYEGPEADLRATLERCLNESLYNQYKLKNVLSEDDIYCNVKPKYPVEKKISGILAMIVTCVLIAIMSLNVIGSLCEYIYDEKKPSRALRLILNFSMLRNWKKLTAQTNLENKSQSPNLMPIHGLRALTLTGVFVSHGAINNQFIVSNSSYVENMQVDDANFICIGGLLTMQTFLVLSSFLLFHTLLTMNEKRQIKWKELPKFIFFRWLRLTPSYALILALTSAYLPGLYFGPMMYKYVDREIFDCRNNWWKHLLFINNFDQDSYCFGHTWYLAVDFQLYVFALVMFLVYRNPRVRRILFPSLCAAVIIISAVNTYIYDLDGLTITSPESLLEKFTKNPTYFYDYIKSPTNACAYIAGAVVAYFVHHLQKNKIDFNKYRTLMYRSVFWSLFPVGLYMCHMAGYYSTVYPKPPLIVRCLIAAFNRPVYNVTFAGLFLGTLLSIESLYRNVLEWRWFVPLSRISYTSYLIHHCFMVLTLGNLQRMTEASTALAEASIKTMFVVAYGSGFVLWLLFEAPIQGVVKEVLRGKGDAKTVQTKEEKKKKINQTKEMKKEKNKTKEAPKIYENGAKPRKQGTA